MKPLKNIVFPENAVFENLLANHKIAFKCITLDAINAYFIERSAEASRSKGRNLGMNMMVERIGIHKSGSETFVKFECHAEMKKQVLYIGKIHFSDEFGINCSNCSCPAGSGWSAACKHVAAAFYVMEHFHQTGILQKKIYIFI